MDKMFCMIAAFIGISSAGRGVATRYGSTGPGLRCNPQNVVPQNSFPYGNFAATGSYLWDYGYECGACYEVVCKWPAQGGDCQCTGETVKIEIMDNCPECMKPEDRPDGVDIHLDLSEKAFYKIATPNCGMITVDYWRVDCDYTGNIQLRTQGSSSNPAESHYNVLLYVSNVAKRGAIRQIELISKNGNWFKCERNNDFWFCNNRQPLTTDYPYDVKFIDDEGRELLAYDLIWSFQQGKVYDTGVQYR